MYVTNYPQILKKQGGKIFMPYFPFLIFIIQLHLAFSLIECKAYKSSDTISLNVIFFSSEKYSAINLINSLLTLYVCM